MLKNWPEKGRNVVFYPRKYHIDDVDPSNSYVEGVSIKGIPFKIKIQLAEDYLDSIKADTEKVAPTMELFASADRRNNPYCGASLENGPGAEDRQGVILFSKVFPTEDREVFTAGWAVVLAADEYAPEPLHGVGRMEISYLDLNFETSEVVSLQNELTELKRSLKGSEDKFEIQGHILRLNSLLDEKRQIKFRAVFDYVNEVKLISEAGLPFSPSDVEEAAYEALERYTTDDGRYGGFTLRVRDSDTVINELSFELSKYFLKDQPVSTDKVWGDFLRYKGGNSILRKIARNNNLTVELIPSQRINCGPKGNALYKKPKELSMLRQTFVHGQEETFSMNAMISVRPVITRKGSANTILGSIYATSSPLGNVLSMDEKARVAYKIDYLENKAA